MATAGISAHRPDPGLIFENLNAYQRTAALKAAIEMDVFSVIGRGSRSADAIAQAVGALTRGLRILCDYLVISGFLAKDSDGYALSADSGVFLDRSSPAYLSIRAKVEHPFRILKRVFGFQGEIQRHRQEPQPAL